MLDILSNGFKQARDQLKGVSTLSEENLKEALNSVRQSLLDADVEYGVAKTFLKRIHDGGSSFIGLIVKASESAIPQSRCLGLFQIRKY